MVDLSVPDLNAICIDRCVTDALECIIDCGNDVDCVGDCLRDQAQCNQGQLKVIHSLLDFKLKA